MVLKIISLICVMLTYFAAGVLSAFVIFKLRKIDSQTESILKHHWSMGIYMNKIPQNEQNTAYLSSVPLKIYKRDKYSNLPVPRVGEEVSGVYYSGENKFEMTGVVSNVFYNTNMDLIVVECDCSEIHKK